MSLKSFLEGIGLQKYLVVSEENEVDDDVLQQGSPSGDSKKKLMIGLGLLVAAGTALMGCGSSDPSCKEVCRSLADYNIKSEGVSKEKKRFAQRCLQICTQDEWPGSLRSCYQAERSTDTEKCKKFEWEQWEASHCPRGTKLVRMDTRRERAIGCEDDEGRVQGKKTIWKHGRRWKVLHYHDDQRHGLYTKYDTESGKMMLQGEYLNDVKHGKWTSYNREGGIDEVKRYQAPTPNVAGGPPPLEPRRRPPAVPAPAPPTAVKTEEAPAPAQRDPKAEIIRELKALADSICSASSMGDAQASLLRVQMLVRQNSAVATTPAGQAIAQRMSGCMERLASAPQPVAAAPQTLGLPAQLAEPRAQSDRVAARKHNKTGLKLHLDKRWSDAIPHYRKAIMTDPSHVLARYNLACAYALVGESDFAIQILMEFNSLGCKLCRKQLKAARKDKDFVSIRNDARFQALTGRR
jgi:hypothetical protein